MNWIRERGRDYYYKLAKRKGYRSRSAFKLLEIARRYRFLREGDVVVDLGAAPGGWMQVSREFVGESGYVLGVDLLEIEPFPWENVKAIVGDILNPDIIKRIKEELPKEEVDVVLCDASPKVSGIWEVDHARQMELVENSLRIAREILKSGGVFFSKAFQGGLFDDLLMKVRSKFEKVKLVKPKASRPKSAEIYILARRFKRL
jgi:23S rRNA (uridine2552-2'-O)-methyltransferase